MATDGKLLGSRLNLCLEIKFFKSLLMFSKRDLKHPQTVERFLFQLERLNPVKLFVYDRRVANYLIRIFIYIFRKLIFSY